MSDSKKPIDINIPAYKAGFSVTEKQIQEVLDCVGKSRKTENTGGLKGLTITKDADNEKWLMMTDEEGMTGFAPLP